MELRGIFRGRAIELESDPMLLNGTTVEVELSVSCDDPRWGLLASKPDLIQAIEQIVHERKDLSWRTEDEVDPT